MKRPISGTIPISDWTNGYNETVRGCLHGSPFFIVVKKGFVGKAVKGESSRSSLFLSVAREFPFSHFKSIRE
jgi:hypothetical protein